MVGRPGLPRLHAARLVREGSASRKVISLESLNGRSAVGPLYATLTQIIGHAGAFRVVPSLACLLWRSCPSAFGGAAASSSVIVAQLEIVGRESAASRTLRASVFRSAILVYLVHSTAAVVLV